MIILVFEKTIDGVCSVAENIKRRFPINTQVYVSSKISKDSLQKYNHPPLITGGWLFCCMSTVKIDILRTLVRIPGNNTILIEVQSSIILTSTKELLDSLHTDYKFIDNHKPPIETVSAYIKTQLPGTTDDVAGYLYNRYNGYMPDIVITVDTLKQFNFVTKDTIRKYGVPRNKYALYDLADCLLGVQTKITYEQAISIIYDYQYAFPKLLKYLKGVIDEYILVFTELEHGHPTYYDMKISNKTIAAMQPYRVQKIINNYNSVSMESLLYLQCRLDRLKTQRFTIYKLIALLQIYNRRSA